MTRGLIWMARHRCPVLEKRLTSARHPSIVKMRPGKRLSRNNKMRQEMAKTAVASFARSRMPDANTCESVRS